MASVQYPKTNKEKAALYAEAIHEIRVRLRAIDKIVKSSLPDMITRESVYLQLRLCVECFAIGCLAAQGDFETHRSFKEDYSPINIFKALEQSYPHFFPLPSKMVSVGDGQWHFDDQGQGNTITREEMEKIWQRSGDHLHRTSAKKYIRKRNQKTNVAEIGEMIARIWNLIMDHRIMLADKTSWLRVSVDRNTDKMQCNFLHLNTTSGTVAVENFAIAIAG